MHKYLAIALLLVAGSFSQALTLKEKKELAEAQTRIAGDEGHASQFKKNCGFSMPVTIDEKLATPLMANSTSFMICAQPVEAMASMCGDATSKEAIKAKVKKVTCKFGGSDGKAEFKLVGGDLQVSITGKPPYIIPLAKEFLENNL